MRYTSLSLALLLLAVSASAEVDSVIIGDSLLECNKLYSHYPDANYGANTELTILAPGSSSDRRGIVYLRAGVLEDSIPVGYEADSARLWVRVLTANGASISLYKVFVDKLYEGTRSTQNTSENGTTCWNRVYYPDSSWTTAGCGSADNNGSRHRADGTGADRASTPWSTVVCATSNRDTCFAIRDSVWLRDAQTNGYGIPMIMIGNSVNLITTMASDDYATAELRPRLVVYTHATVAVDGVVRTHMRKGHLRRVHI